MLNPWCVEAAGEQAVADRDLHYNEAGFFDIHVLLGDFNHGSLSKPATFSVRQ
jgi:hypothetical protein